MRITNSMMSSRMLININKNMRASDLLYNQIATTKRVNYPSENPILASRVLKFRTNVAETEQYQRNVDQGLSWMELTDYGINNAQSILKSIRELAVVAASDQNAYDDRQKIASSIEQYFKQLSAEMNITYAGRYVFSGYRTDQPCTYETDTNEVFQIKQSFVGGNIETIKSYQKLSDVQEPTSYKADILKTAYKDITGTIPIKLYTTGGAGNPVTSSTKTLLDPDAYTPGADEIYVIAETGELVLGSNISAALRKGGSLDIEYTKDGISKGEPNPRVYFECKDITGLTGADIADTTKGTYYNSPGYTMDDHVILNEFGVNMKIEINALGKNIYTDKFFSDLRSIVDLLKRVELSDTDALRQHYIDQGITDETELKKKIEDQLSNEKQKISDILQEKYSNLLGIVDKQVSIVSTQQTDVGTRMGRLQLISNRLIDDKISYKKLLSDNEDTDMMEASMLLNEAQNAFQASLQVGANIIQLSLANFIR